jgi:hypothetical protein
VVWTRDYIIAAVGGYPDQQPAAERLLRNQDDIGSAIPPYYGKAAADKLTALLKDQATFQAVDTKWQKNGEDIADFLSKA